MFHDPEHPNTTSSDWQAFCRDFSRYRFAEVIDRSELNIPDEFVPLARGVAIPSEEVLRKVGCRPGSIRPANWKHPSRDVFHQSRGQWGPYRREKRRFLGHEPLGKRSANQGIGIRVRLHSNFHPYLPSRYTAC